MAVADSTKTIKISSIYVSTTKNLVWTLCGCSLPLGIGGSVKRHAAKRSLQRPLDNQILDYEAMFEVCEEMSSIKFFGISKETMTGVRKSLEERFSRGNTVPGTRSSHHFVPLSSSKIAHKLTSEDDFYVNTHDFDLPTMVELSNITPSTYVTCLYDLFWWVGIVSNVDIEQGDVKVDFMHPHGPRKTFNWPESDDTCYVPTKNILCYLNPHHIYWTNVQDH